MCALEIYT